MEWTRVMEWVRVWGNKPGQMSWLGFEGTSRVKESLRLMERVRPNELVRVWWKELVRVWWNQWARVDGMNEWMNTLRWKSWSRLMCWSRLMEQVRGDVLVRLMEQVRVMNVRVETTIESNGRLSSREWRATLSRNIRGIYGEVRRVTGDTLGNWERRATL